MKSTLLNENFTLTISPNVTTTLSDNLSFKDIISSPFFMEVQLYS